MITEQRVRCADTRARCDRQRRTTRLEAYLLQGGSPDLSSLNQGYTILYERNFTYATVKGAGHMVPMFRPEAAQTLVQRFVEGGDVFTQTAW